MNTDKEENKRLIQKKAEKAAIASYIRRKENKLTKLDDLKYTTFELQPYFSCPEFGPKEVKIISLLRSKSHPAKANFRKLHRDNIKCSLGCNSEETQIHIFEQCTPILNIIGPGKHINLSDIYGTLDSQKSIIKILVHIEDIRVNLIKKMQNN